MFKGTQTLVRGKETQLEGRFEQKSEDLGALELEMRWDTGATAEGQLTAQIKVLGGSIAMVGFSLLQSKTIYPVISQGIQNSVDPGQTYFEDLPCTKDILDSGDKLVKKTKSLPS